MGVRAEESWDNNASTMGIITGGAKIIEQN